MSQKFHVNAKQEVKVCNADKRACRYADSPHGASKEELQEKIDLENSKKYSAFSIQKKSKKPIEVINPVKNLKNQSESENIKELREILKTVNIYSSQQENILKIGKLFEEEVKERAGFDIDGEWLQYYSKEKLRKIEKFNQEILSEITKTGTELENAEGEGAAELNAEARLLPSGTIKSLNSITIQTTDVATIHKKFGEISKDPQGIFAYSPHIDQDMYIGIDKNANHRKSTYLHELTHAVQQRASVMNTVSVSVNSTTNNTKNSEDAMFDDCSNLIQPPMGGAAIERGFPDSYMGHPSKIELFPVATQKFLYPTDNNKLYGKGRNKNADKIRQWISGYWIVLDKQLSQFWE